jgi:hypothetical protein
MQIAKLTRKGLHTDKHFGNLQNRIKKMPDKIKRDVEHQIKLKQAIKAKSTPDTLIKEKENGEDTFVGKGTVVSVKLGSFDKQQRSNKYIIGLTKQGVDWSVQTAKEHDAECASYQPNQQLFNTISLPGSPSARPMSSMRRDRQILEAREQRRTYAKDMERERDEAAKEKGDYEHFSYDDDDSEDGDTFLQRKLASQKRLLRQQSQISLTVHDDHGAYFHFNDTINSCVVKSVCLYYYRLDILCALSHRQVCVNTCT